MAITHIVETHGNAAELLLGTCTITHQFNGARIQPKTTSTTASDYVLLPMTTPTLLNGKALALSRVKVRFFAGSAATVKRIYHWKGEEAAFVTVDVNRTVSGVTSIAFTVSNQTLGQAIGLSFDLDLKSSGWVALSGAGLFFSETNFGLDDVLEKNPGEEPLEAVMTLTDAT